MMMSGVSQVDRLIAYQRLRRVVRSDRRSDSDRRESDHDIDTDSLFISEEAQRKFDAARK